MEASFALTPFIFKSGGTTGHNKQVYLARPVPLEVDLSHPSQRNRTGFLFVQHGTNDEYIRSMDRGESVGVAIHCAHGRAMPCPFLTQR